MQTLASIQSFIATQLVNNAEFTTLCVDTIGSKLNFYTDSSILRADEVMPFLVVHKFNKAYEIDKEPEWIVQMLIGIESEEKYIESGGIRYYQSTSSVETIADKAIEIIKCDLAAVGVEGNKKLFIQNYNVLITEIGEADDIQAIVTIRLQSTLYI